MSKPFRDSSSGVGLDVVVTLPASVCEQIEVQAKERGGSRSIHPRFPRSANRVRNSAGAGSTTTTSALSGRLRHESLPPHLGIPRVVHGASGSTLPAYLLSRPAMDVKNARRTDQGPRGASAPPAMSGTDLHEAARNPVG